MDVAIEVLLGVIAPNIKQPGNTKFLLWNTPDSGLFLPTTEILACEEAAQSAGRLLEELTGIKASDGWANLVNIGIADHPGRRFAGRRLFSVLFGCMIPETTQPGCEHLAWMTLRDIYDVRTMSSDHFDLLHQIARKV